jgi:FG-GAP repeat.
MISVCLFSAMTLAILLALQIKPVQIAAAADGCNAPSFANALNFPAGSSPRWLAVGDFNADGKLDLAILNFTGSGTVSIILGDGAGHFGPPASYAVGSAPRFVAAADFNSDGKLDLAVANSNSDNVSILLGNGNGSFGAATNFAVGRFPWALAADDFNGDGKLDLAVSNYSDNLPSTVSILLGNGAGGFSAQTTFPVGSGPGAVIAGDFNHDGKPDLAVLNLGSSDISILIGNGAGSFSGPTTSPTGVNPFDMTLADLNGDGNLDLATTNPGFPSSTISILLGNGNGGFPAATHYPVAASNIVTLATADFNADGKLDMVAGNFDNNYVSVLLGDGNGGIGAATNFAAGPIPFVVAVADFNGDNRPDVAAGNRDGASVSILLNTCSMVSPPPPTADSDIVLYASEASTMVGNWQVVQDATAAGGARIWNPNQGQPKIPQASPNPANYFQLTFDAPAGRIYHLWVRSKAQNDDYNNDSVYIQFSDSVNQNGEVAYRIGTTSYISAILEDCTGAGVQGWGWADNEWCGTGVNIYFANSGTHTIRVQQREDGVSIDQIVLSPLTYLHRSPGALKNDTTILPKSTGGF